MSNIWENEEILSLMRKFIEKASKREAVCECNYNIASEDWFNLIEDKYQKELTDYELEMLNEMEIYFSVFPKSEYVEEHWISNLNTITDNIFRKVLTSSKLMMNKGLDSKMVSKSYVYLLYRFILGIVKGNEDEIESIVNTIESIMFY